MWSEIAAALNLLDNHYLAYTARLLDQDLIVRTTHISAPHRVTVSLNYTNNQQLDGKIQDKHNIRNPAWL